MNKRTYERWSRVVALSLKLVGLAGILFVPVFWAVTYRVELAFLPFFATLATAGLGVDAAREYAQSRMQFPQFPPIDTSKEEEEK